MDNIWNEVLPLYGDDGQQEFVTENENITNITIEFRANFTVQFASSLEIIEIKHNISTLHIYKCVNLQKIVGNEAYKIDKIVVNNCPKFQVSCLKQFNISKIQLIQSGDSVKNESGDDSVKNESHDIPNEASSVIINECQWFTELPSGQYNTLTIQKCQNFTKVNAPIFCNNLILEELENLESLPDGNFPWIGKFEPPITNSEIFAYINSNRSSFQGIFCEESLFLVKCNKLQYIPRGIHARFISLDNLSRLSETQSSIVVCNDITITHFSGLPRQLDIIEEDRIVNNIRRGFIKRLDHLKTNIEFYDIYPLDIENSKKPKLEIKIEYYTDFHSKFILIPINSKEEQLITDMKPYMDNLSMDEVQKLIDEVTYQQKQENNEYLKRELAFLKMYVQGHLSKLPKDLLENIFQMTL